MKSVGSTAFMSGKEAANLFRTHQVGERDRATANAIADQIAQLDREADSALAHDWRKIEPAS